MSFLFSYILCVCVFKNLNYAIAEFTVNLLYFSLFKVAEISYHWPMPLQVLIQRRMKANQNLWREFQGDSFYESSMPTELSCEKTATWKRRALSPVCLSARCVLRTSAERYPLESFATALMTDGSPNCAKTCIASRKWSCLTSLQRSRKAPTRLLTHRKSRNLRARIL